MCSGLKCRSFAAQKNHFQAYQVSMKPMCVQQCMPSCAPQCIQVKSTKGREYSPIFRLTKSKFNRLAFNSVCQVAHHNVSKLIKFLSNQLVFSSVCRLVLPNVSKLVTVSVSNAIAISGLSGASSANLHSTVHAKLQ